ncbi:DUF4184 family protein [Paenibacillus sp. 481]|uniref:DUF4184 family protein n=1 Tax=Paenibacillus sp. 481 TaxID=2835869 RepID=UPI001E5DB807|nr:DUF4184 family protein [Paenibacillus sp. 481]UHA72775.1 DUF4184 family protein [Paenibacillus sp. 481]
MPFTFAHPLYAVPFHRMGMFTLSLSGLILGSMAPDFEYFIALEPHQVIGHTFKGLLLEAIPLSILFAWLFHYVIKHALVLHLPSWFDLDRRAYQLIRSWRLRSYKDWLIFIGSVVIGFATHVFLDAWTHRSGWFVTAFPGMQQPIVAGIPLYKMMQHGLSLLGLTIEGVLLWKLLAGRRYSSADTVKSAPTPISFVRVSTASKVRYWGVVIFVVLLIVIAKFTISESSNMIGILVVSPLSGIMLGVTIASLMVKFRLLPLKLSNL